MSKKATEREFPITYNKQCLILLSFQGLCYMYCISSAFRVEPDSVLKMFQYYDAHCTNHFHSKYEADGGMKQSIGLAVRVMVRVEAQCYPMGRGHVIKIEDRRKRDETDLVHITG